MGPGARIEILSVAGGGGGMVNATQEVRHVGLLVLRQSSLIVREIIMEFRGSALVF